MQLRIDSRRLVYQLRTSSSWSFKKTAPVDLFYKASFENRPAYSEFGRAAYMGNCKTNASRGWIVLMITETDPKVAEFNQAFVLMQYIGYLRRDPNQGPHQFWQNNLNKGPSNFRGMVCAFINSTETEAFQFGRSRNDHSEAPVSVRSVKGTQVAMYAADPNKPIYVK